MAFTAGAKQILSSGLSGLSLRNQVSREALEFCWGNLVAVLWSHVVGDRINILLYQLISGSSSVSTSVPCLLSAVLGTNDQTVLCRGHSSGHASHRGSEPGSEGGNLYGMILGNACDFWVLSASVSWALEGPVGEWALISSCERMTVWNHFVFSLKGPVGNITMNGSTGWKNWVEGMSRSCR